MNYILSHTSLSSTTKLLSKELGLPVFTVPQKTAPTIRWGNSSGSYLLGQDSELNLKSIIQVAGSKLAFANCIEKHNIPHVEYYREVLPESFPVVVRTIENGHGGEGIVVCKNWEEFNPYKGSLWSCWYDFSFELGVHVLGGKVTRVFKKVWSSGEGGDEDAGTPEPDFPIRNLEKGYKFSLIFPETVESKYKKLLALVEEFYKVFPLGMGRLDIGWDNISKVYRIIECNSAPALSNNVNTLKAYVDFLKGKIGG